MALLKDLTNAPLPSADFVRGMLAVGYGMVFIYALRGAGMYALTTTSLLREAGIMPKWLALVSYLLAAVPAVEHGAAPSRHAPLPHLGRGRRPGGLHPRRSCRRTGRIRKAIRMTTPQSDEDRQTAPLTIDDIPGPKGKPLVGNMFDVPAERSIQTLMEFVPRVRADDSFPHSCRRPIHSLRTADDR